MNSVIHISDLAIGYKNHIVAQNINFQLGAGELSAIIGINGIGKSTLLRTLAGLQKQLKGTVHLNGQHLDSYSAKSLARDMSIVLTEAMATKNLTVKELIALGRQPHTNWLGTLTDADKKHITKSLELFKLNDLSEKKCYELSDGQLQRVLIARSVAQDTPIILLDEPTTHLDLSHKIEILKLLKQLAHEHRKTVVFTTHELDLAIQLCDKILILDGTKNDFGSPCELIEKGSFDQLFPKESVFFDTKTGKFSLKN